jgi:hypothetical protein
VGGEVAARVSGGGEHAQGFVGSDLSGPVRREGRWLRRGEDRVREGRSLEVLPDVDLYVADLDWGAAPLRDRESEREE